MKDEENNIKFTLSSGEDMTEQRYLEAKHSAYWDKAAGLLAANLDNIRESTNNRKTSNLSSEVNKALLEALEQLKK